MSATPLEYMWDIDSTAVRLRLKAHLRTVYITAPTKNGLYPIEIPTCINKANSSKADAQPSQFKANSHYLQSKVNFKANLPEEVEVELVYEMHRNLGHLNIGTMALMARSGQFAGLKSISTATVNSFQCLHRIMAKEKRQPPSTNASKRATTPVERTNCNIWGPSCTPSVGGHRYFLTIIDDFSRYCDITIMRNKSDALAALEPFVNQAETQLGHKVKEVRSAGGAEFKSKPAVTFYNSKGIVHSTTPPGAHA